MSAAVTNAIDVANWFLTWASQDEEQPDISNLKLQKLLYFSQGHHLAKTGKPLFSDEIQAWAHGPVVPAVYREFKSFEGNPIVLEKPVDFERFPKGVNDLLASIWYTFGGFSAWKLREMTHQNGPWKDVHEETSFGAVISIEAMQDYFGSLYSKRA